MKNKVLAITLGMLLLPAGLQAFGSHDNDCTECHGIHAAKGRSLIAVAPVEAANPTTGAPVKDVSALCLGCHSAQGGVLEIDLMKSHPIGITPKQAKVPAPNLSLDGALTCMSCHDPHPSNPNYKYLIGKVASAKEMGAFCAICHPDKRE